MPVCKMTGNSPVSSLRSVIAPSINAVVTVPTRRMHWPRSVNPTHHRLNWKYRRLPIRIIFSTFFFCLFFFLTFVAGNVCSRRPRGNSGSVQETSALFATVRPLHPRPSNALLFPLPASPLTAPHPQKKRLQKIVVSQISQRVPTFF